MSKKLLILGCSDLKRHSKGPLLAIDRYDGPAYRVLRRYLRNHQWPDDVSIAVLSAKYGLFGILKAIDHYDKRMDPGKAGEMAQECSSVLTKWADSHGSVHLSLGKDYLPALQPALDRISIKSEIFHGGIGQKQSRVKSFLTDRFSSPRKKVEVEGGTNKYYYFLPDWDDLLDPDFDFEADLFSGPTRTHRNDKHCSRLMQPKRMSDGILVSLAQQGTQKGPLRRIKGTELNALSPPPLRRHFGLTDDQYLFGDCGAFSYMNEEYPTISVEHAVALYESYSFDFGASVDHMPVTKIIKNGIPTELSDSERQARVEITRENAELFIESARQRKVTFNPVGTIQALSAEHYAQTVRDYYELGYRHVAIGSLVPKPDKEIEAVVRAVAEAASRLKQRPWIHLFGIFRPKLQDLFRQLRIDSFDSATYFRKAWLRSDQNYLSVDGQWYAAIRVPMTSDGRTRKRLQRMNADIDELEREERAVLRLLCQYERNEVEINEVLDAVLHYDRQLARSSETQSMQARYRRTLEERPWRKCSCSFCKDLGIHVLIFRGANRNKRRGAHNTLMLYGQLNSS